MRKILSAAITAGIITSMGVLPSFADAAALSPTALPQFNHGTNVSVAPEGDAKLNITIDPNGKADGAVGTAYWDTFNIGKDAHVEVVFTNHHQTSLNKVSASGGISQIYGKFTNTCGNNCGYAGTGKVILLNPNGILFGDGANVNLNSFTASTLDMDGDYTKNYKGTNLGQIKLKKGSDQSDFGIEVKDGATIYGDKGVTFAANNIKTYKGSQITTNISKKSVFDSSNVEDRTAGKVKLMTTDGITFEYYTTGEIATVNDNKTLTSSTNKMTLSLEGDITSGHIDARNTSAHNDSELVVTNGAKLKAYKAEKGNDGNIWLISNNRLITDHAEFTTANIREEASSRSGGNVLMMANQKTTLNTDNIDAVGDVQIQTSLQGNGYQYTYTDADGNVYNWSNDGNANVDNTVIKTNKDVLIKSNYNIASVQNSSNVKGNNVTIQGKNNAQVSSNSKVEALNDLNIKSTDKMACADNATLKAGNDINLESENYAVQLTKTTTTAARDINMKAKSNITSTRFGNSTFTAGRNINMESTENNIHLTGTSQFTPTGILSLKAKNDVQIAQNDALTVAKTKIEAGNDITLQSNNNDLTVKSTTEFVNAKNINLNAGRDVLTDGTLNVNNLKTNIAAVRNVDVTLTNAGNRAKGLVAQAGNNMKVTTAGTLSIADLRANNDMTLNANKVIKSTDYDYATPTLGGFTDASARAYIEVGGTFTSNVTEDDFESDANKGYIVSKDLTNDGQYNQRHHIQYGNEKVYLVNKRPVDNVVGEVDITDPARGIETDVDSPEDLSDDVPVIVKPVIPTPNPEPTPEPEPTPGTGDEEPDCSGTPAAIDELIIEANPFEDFE